MEDFNLFLFKLFLQLCSEVPLHLQSLEQFYPPVPGTLLEMGCVELSKDATVEDLKNMILTLPAVCHLSLTIPHFRPC